MIREGWMVIFQIEHEDGSKTFTGGSIHTSEQCAIVNGVNPLEGSKLFGPVKIQFDDSSGWYKYEKG